MKYRKLLSKTVFVITAMMSISTMTHADTITQQYSVAANEQLLLRTDTGSINVRTHNNNTVDIEVEVEGPNSDAFKLTFEQSSTGVDVKGELDKHDWSWSSRLRVKFYIYVPSEFNLDLITAGGSIAIDDLFGNVEARTSGGSISLGDITGNVDIHTSGGSINVDSVYGDIDANTSGGSINVSFAKQITQDATLTTSGGSITATLPEDINIDLSASTSGGSVKSEFDVSGHIKKRSIKGTINNGGPKLTLRTSGGSVRINKD